MSHLLLVGFFGAVGATLRYITTIGCARWFGEDFPYGTLIVNVAGCFMLAFVGELTIKKAIPPHWQVAFGTGLLGALTTFSTFGFDTVRKLESGQWQHAILNVGANVCLGLVAVYLGLLAVRGILGD
ncbi:MAG: CrcB protein [Pirellulaceae bacterium]|jgi:CrcB protein